MRISNTSKRIHAMLVAAALALLVTLAGGFIPAHAQEAQEVPPPGAGDINPELNGSITVHKYAFPAWAADNYPNSGKAFDNTPEGATPLSGVEFTIQKVDGLDITSPEDWKIISGLQIVDDEVKNADGTATYFLADGTEQTKTTTAGTATFRDLPLGVYLVTEGKDTGKNNITTKAAPFLVVLPTPDPTPDPKAGWIYDVHVYPKNSVTAVSKEVNDEAAFEGGENGDIVYWNIKVKIPEGGNVTALKIVDTLDPRLKYDVGTEVTMSNDLTIQGHFEVNEEGQKLTITFTPKGIDALNTTLAGKEITIKVPTRVDDIPDGDDGIIPNKATVFFNGSETGIETNKPDTPWGKLKIVKYDKVLGVDDGALSGAVFGVYKSEQNANAFEEEIAELTTDTLGKADIILKAGEYWLKEKTAPAGYILAEDPIKVTINPKGTEELGGQFVVFHTEEIPNTKQTVPTLPITGANGRILLISLGLALVLSAGGIGLVTWRRWENQK